MSFWLTINREFHRRRSNLESLVSCDYMFVLLRGRLSQQSRRQIVDIKLLIAQNLLIMKARFDNHKLSFFAKYVCVCVWELTNEEREFAIQWQSIMQKIQFCDANCRRCGDDDDNFIVVHEKAQI